ncbi:diguanylate cyclase/phosphodiesterase (GGDEF & EAL domains) with PAS/PAC sensor(s) [hydrothermal vent metagenome]|uniref:Diguanylate cyclase/phosphodiesterase (GGDEF & EAL domains) with PAS/PAC sensor(S) n=1 Tax=hydrothermal vent metagenome TaxID=652676 RepID=A0A3B0ZBR5_9ZZZZ
MSIPLQLLIVDDSENDSLLLVRELTKGGYDVSHERVDNSEDMRHAIAGSSWDIIITDHNMPGFDSTQALKIASDSNIDTPVIIVSGNMGEAIAVDAMKSGAMDYIMKDNLSRLVPAVQREVRESESRKARRQAEQTIIHMAYHDALTGLANRNEFEHRLKDAITVSKLRHIHHGLMYLDLDQFKIINDTCGHVAGDELLRQLSNVLNSQIRETDTLARLGGDEFGILLDNCPIETATTIADSIIKEINRFSFQWQNKSIDITTSIGLVAINNKSRNVSSVLSCADIACYTAKDLGRNRIHIYKEDDKELLRRHGEMQWVSRIRTAIQNDEFLLYRQNMMVVDQQESELSSFEFLLRLRDKTGEIIPPGAFIPAAERYNLMPDLDRWVINRAFRYLSENSKRLKSGSDSFFAFINLSGASLSDDKFFNYIRDKFQEYNLDQKIVCFEITETAAITNLQRAIDFIRDIKQQGCHFALDDFGSGLSSFTYLKNIPVDFLKIDGSFVRNMLYDDMDAAFVAAINQLGHVANLKTIAEFVENEQTLERLKDIGVDYAQGYGIHLPESIDDEENQYLESLVKRSNDKL